MNVALPTRDLVRAMPTKVELRADEAGGMPTLVVRFARFNVWNEIDSAFEGHFMERVDPKAFVRTFKQDRDRMRTLFQHGRDPVVGDKPLAPITELRSEAEGPVMAGQMLDTSYNRDILPGLEAGVYGSSYRFRVMHEDIREDPEPSEDNPDGLPERTILEARVFEAGPVTFPADPGASAGVRSLTDWYLDTAGFQSSLRTYVNEKPKELAQLIERAMQTEPPTTIEEPTETPPTDAAASDTGDNPPSSERRVPLYGQDKEDDQPWRL